MIDEKITPEESTEAATPATDVSSADLAVKKRLHQKKFLDKIYFEKWKGCLLTLVDG